METNSKHKVMIEANVENIEATFNKIQEFANSKSYVIEGELKHPTNLIGVKKSLNFDSQKQKKKVRNFINRLAEHITLSQSNRFLHLLFKKIYKVEKGIPKIKLSDREVKIQAARQAWVKARNEAEQLRLAYVKEKGNFYGGSRADRKIKLDKAA